jgi:small subunit ribosomal protein S16
MAVRIRLSRAGTTNRPYWRVVAMDSRAKRDGAYLDKLGTYDPLQHQVITLDVAGIKAWEAKGAQCSATVTRLMKQHAKAQKASAEVQPEPAKKTRAPRKKTEEVAVEAGAES